MDNASAYGAEDCRFDPYHGRNSFAHLVHDRQAVAQVHVLGAVVREDADEGAHEAVLEASTLSPIQKR